MHEYTRSHALGTEGEIDRAALDEALHPRRFLSHLQEHQGAFSAAVKERCSELFAAQ